MLGIDDEVVVCLFVSTLRTSLRERLSDWTWPGLLELLEERLPTRPAVYRPIFDLQGKSMRYKRRAVLMSVYLWTRFPTIQGETTGRSEEKCNHASAELILIRHGCARLHSARSE